MATGVATRGYCNWSTRVATTSPIAATRLAIAATTGPVGCQVSVKIPTQKPIKTSPKVAHLLCAPN